MVRLASLFPLTATSWGRTAHQNAKVGGVPHSAHRVWVAVDLIADGPVDVEELKEWGRRLELKVIPEEGHFHVQPWEWERG